MPFELSATTHVFTKTKDGGLQRVVAKNPGDNEQIHLIRLHLDEIARRFARGDFSAPIAIHGSHMPGVAELTKAKRGELRVTYSELANGGQIEYAARDPNLVVALHRWIDAQLSDHGRDAQEVQEHHEHAH